MLDTPPRQAICTANYAFYMLLRKLYNSLYTSYTCCRRREAFWLSGWCPTNMWRNSIFAATTDAANEMQQQNNVDSLSWWWPGYLHLCRYSLPSPPVTRILYIRILLNWFQCMLGSAVWQLRDFIFGSPANAMQFNGTRTFDIYTYIYTIHAW